MKPVRVNYDKGSIRNNFEQVGDNESEDENEMQRRRTSPGPGSYQTMRSTFNLQPQNNASPINGGRPNSISIFGSTVNRFMDKPVGTSLGPGQYKPRIAGKSHNSALAVAGSAAFKSKQRPDMIDALKSYERPAPGEYSKQQLNNTFT